MAESEPRDSHEFEQVAQAVWDDLPDEFREAAGNISIQIVDFADPDTLAHFGMRSRYNLLGLYHGIGLPFKSVMDVSQGPDMVFLYRLPILAYAQATMEPVSLVIRHVLIHEIGHHFGFSDDDMDAIEAATQ